MFRSEPPSKLRFLEKGYFISLLPLLVLLFVGIFRRLHDYSLTSARYIVLAGACWLTVASVLMLVVQRNCARSLRQEYVAPNMQYK